jgi:hypothetical protein
LFITAGKSPVNREAMPLPRLLAWAREHADGVKV